MNNSLSLGFAVLLLFSTFFLSILPERPIELNCENEACFLNLAKETNNSNYCSYSTNTSKCYYYMALHLKNQTLCDFEINTTLCLQSYAISLGDSSLCLTLDNISKFDCILSYAITWGDLESCTLLDNQSYCYYSYALYYKDPILCSLTQEYRKDCITYLENGNN